jgi:hypothetical protein
MEHLGTDYVDKALEQANRAFTLRETGHLSKPTDPAFAHLKACIAEADIESFMDEDGVLTM